MVPQTMAAFTPTWRGRPLLPMSFATTDWSRGGTIRSPRRPTKSAGPTRASPIPATDGVTSRNSIGLLQSHCSAGPACSNLEAISSSVEAMFNETRNPTDPLATREITERIPTQQVGKGEAPPRVTGSIREGGRLDVKSGHAAGEEREGVVDQELAELRDGTHPRQTGSPPSHRLAAVFVPVGQFVHESSMSARWSITP